VRERQPISLIKLLATMRAVAEGGTHSQTDLNYRRMGRANPAPYFGLLQRLLQCLPSNGQLQPRSAGFEFRFG
jgi:hypothetical protein